MPNIKSAAKRLRQSIVRRQRNRAIKRAVKTQCRKVEDALQEGNADQARAEFALATRKLDQAAAKRAIHRNAAARVKSRLAAKMKATLPKPVKAQAQG